MQGQGPEEGTSAAPPAVERSTLAAIWPALVASFLSATCINLLFPFFTFVPTSGSTIPLPKVCGRVVHSLHKGDAITP